MEFELILSDIKQLLELVVEDQNVGCVYNKELIYENYSKIFKLCENIEFLKDTAIGIEKCYQLGEDFGYQASYKTIEHSMEIVKNRIGIYNQHEEKVFIQPCFIEIKGRIIDEIKNAKYLIWIAVAWFTDIDIYDSLIEARNRGLNVQVIMLDDKGNKTNDGKYKLDFSKKIAVGYSKSYMSSRKNLHHKFCIIDFEKTITGSYNWTINATKNDENVVIIKDVETAKSYASKFVKLKSEILQEARA
ncbi:phospholipase D-like domain-containing protein [Acetobacterium sp.]|uniref:phospholipase D-like domain-containing protein n=1 Tax=Acetobacterium sp. TaxID=1872094 RepID=UPI002F414566